MDWDVDKILERIDKVYEDSDNPPQAKRPDEIPKPEYDMKKIEFFSKWADLEEKRKNSALERAKNVHEFIRGIRKQVTDDQKDLMTTFKEALALEKE